MHNIDTIHVMKLSGFVIYSVAFVIFLTPFFLLPSDLVHAQSMPSGTSALTLSASSNNPVPGQTVTITLASYSFNIDSATIIWSFDGNQVQKGIGLTTLDVKAPSLGIKKTIDVNVITTNGQHYNSSIVIGSGSIDTIIETDGYTPPFFNGKIPFVVQNTVKIIALPHLSNTSGKEYDPTSLIYQWKKDDGTVFQDQSGYGKQSLSLTGDIIPRPYNIIVTASTRDGSAQGQSLIQVSPTSPSITFYNNDPLYGPYFNRATTGTLHIGSQKEAKIFASLFGFNFSNDISKVLTLDWMINGSSHPELANNSSIVLRSPDGVAGTANVELNAQGIDNILQGGDASFNVNFDAVSSVSSSTPVTL